MDDQDSAGAAAVHVGGDRRVARPLVPLTALAGARCPGRPGRAPRAVVVLFSLVLVAGELWPIPVARGEEGGDEITVSSTFGFALLLVVPVFFTILAQTVALASSTGSCTAGSGTGCRSTSAQYALAFTAARGTYAVVAGEPFTAVAVGPPDLVASVVAGSDVPAAQQRPGGGRRRLRTCACRCGRCSPRTSPGSS